ESGILSGAGILYLAPTGSGKSLVGEAAAIPHLLRGGMGVWLAPTRALARERADRLAMAFGPAGFRIAVSSRDDRTSDDDIKSGRVDVVVAVYEKARSLFNGSPGFRNRTTLVVADEFQHIDDAERGAAAALL